MKSGFWLVSNTRTFAHTRKLLLMTLAVVYGKYMIFSNLHGSIVMEYSDDGDLFQKITTHQKQSSYINEDDIWKIFIQTVRGLQALHDIKIFHRDLKSANIFLNKNGIHKLGDMNVSKVAKKGLLYTQTGTPYYASPEVWRD